MRYVVSTWNSNGLLSRFEQHALGKHGSRNTGRPNDRFWQCAPKARTTS